VVFQILRETAARVELLLDLRVRDVACHDHRAGQHHARLHCALRQLGADLGHRSREVDAYDVVAQCFGLDLGQEVRRVAFELFEEHAIRSDLAERLPIGRA